MSLFSIGKKKEGKDKAKPQIKGERKPIPQIPQTPKMVVSGDGKGPPTADDIEALQEYAREELHLNLDLSPIAEARRQGKMPSAEAIIHLVKYVLHPQEAGWEQRQPGLTDLNLIQCHLFPMSMVFEQMGKRDYVPGSAAEIYRRGVYVHRLSNKHWFVFQLLALAGLQAEEETIEKSMYGGGPKW